LNIYSIAAINSLEQRKEKLERRQGEGKFPERHLQSVYLSVSTNNESSMTGDDKFPIYY
jgi:hypothetical protein